MAQFRVAFPDQQVWTINITGKSGEEALKLAHARASAARAAEGGAAASYEACSVLKLTPKLRAQLKGMTFLTREALLEECKIIGREYTKRGLALTLRGMYYQLVARGLMPSGQKEYDRVKDTLAKARLRGDFPIDLLTDGSRVLRVGDATRYDLDHERAIRQAREWIPQLDRFFLEIDRWYRQRDLPLVLFEKEALSNVFGPVCEELGVAWLATKGYPSVSTLFELHKLMLRCMDHNVQSEGAGALSMADGADPAKESAHIEEWYGEAEYTVQDALGGGLWSDDFEEDGDPHEHAGGDLWRYRYDKLKATQWHQGGAGAVRILYFGDHDPDGMEIPIDLEYRLKVIQVRQDQLVPFSVERLGLNRDQIEEHNPPPFWAKEASARHAKYMREHAWARGEAWELDALDPTVLQDIVRDAINNYFDAEVHAANEAALAVARERFNRTLREVVLPALLEQG